MDFDGNGTLDLSFSSWSGGNGFHTVEPVIVWWDRSAFKSRDIGGIKNLYDFEKDGMIEIETTTVVPGVYECGQDCDSAMVSFRDILYAPSAVLGWREGELTDISSQVPEFYEVVRLPVLVEFLKKMNKKNIPDQPPGYTASLKCLMGCVASVMARADSLATGPY